MRHERFLSLAAVGGALLAPASPAGAATHFEPYPLSPEVGAYVFIADPVDASTVLLNPGGLGGKEPTRFYLDVSGDDRGPDEGAIAFQGGFLGAAYRHRDAGDSYEIGGEDPFVLVVPEGNFDTYTVGAGFGPRSFQAGVTHEWTKSDLPDWDYSSWNVGVSSRLSRRLSAAATLQDVNEPSVPLGDDGTLAARFTYGVSFRPLPGAVERLTLNAEGSHEKGSTRFDMAYGARFVTDKGLEFGLVLQDPNGGDPEFGGFLTSRWGQGAASLRGRLPRGDWDPSPRWQSAVRTQNAHQRDSLHGSRRVATVTLAGGYEDTPSGFVLAGGESRGARRLIRRIQDASRDGDVRALAVRVQGLDGEFLGPVSAQLEEIRRAILDFRAAGKPVVAYLDQMANGPAEVYMATAADRVVLTPLGGVHSFGVAVNLTREKRFFEKLGVAWEADTAGVYKSSFHGFYTDTTSALQRVAIQGLVEDAHRYLTETVQASRKLSPEATADLATGRIVFPEECVAMGLVDRIGWWEDALREVDLLCGGDGKALPRTMPLPDRRYVEERWVPAPAVGVVMLEGSIQSGESGRNWLMGGRSLGARTAAQQIRAATARGDVRALVLRVDSGGGSALASEEIRQAILRARRETRLPVFVSMGTAAASGGYLIAAPADSIFANRTTRTGSIGVVWATPVLEDLYRKLGITSETFRSGEHTDMFSRTRHLTPEERGMMDAALDYTYASFVSAVAEGRGLTEARVREVGEGRVYFGDEARALGLVDEIGTLDDAVAAAAARAGIGDDYRVVTFLPPSRGIMDRALRAVAMAGSLLDGLGGSGVHVEEE